MANYEKDIEKQSIVDTVKSAVTKTFYKLPQESMIDDDQEGILLKALFQAPNEIPSNLNHYIKLAKQLDMKVDIKATNIKGMCDKTLPFYEDHLQTSSMNTIVKSIASKVVDNNSMIIIDKEEHKLPTNVIKEIEKDKVRYGRVLVNTLPSDKIEDYTFEIIEPYRYEATPTGYRWLTRVGDYVEKTEKYPQMILTTRYRSHNFMTNKEEVLESKSTFIYKGSEWIMKGSFAPMDDNLSYLGLTEFKTEDGKSIVEPIKNELFMLDILDTAIATEVIGGKFQVHLDERFFENGRVHRGDINRIYRTDGEDVSNALFQFYQPNIRDTSFINLKEHYVKQIAMDIGLSAQSLGFTTVQETTATTSLVEEQKTNEVINGYRIQLQSELQKALEEFIECKVNIKQYSFQSLEMKADVMNKLPHRMSIAESIDYLHSERSAEDRLKETVRIKVESGTVLTLAEREVAVKEYGEETLAKIELGGNQNGKQSRQ